MRQCCRFCHNKDCHGCPSPEEIAERSAEIRAEWGDEARGNAKSGGSLSPYFKQVFKLKLPRGRVS